MKIALFFFSQNEPVYGRKEKEKNKKSGNKVPNSEVTTPYLNSRKASTTA